MIGRFIGGFQFWRVGKIVCAVLEDVPPGTGSRPRERRDPERSYAKSLLDPDPEESRRHSRPGRRQERVAQA
ncbi:hypothetical protein GCM10010222_65610 [Streptomyces tanashiensis]|nr:hypothetical protein GCM10010222_65610 [Streptomyces tanashiensis]